MNTNQIIDPPPGVTWQETADGGTITIKMVWWQRIAWGLLLLSGNMAGFWLMSLLQNSVDNLLMGIVFVGLIGINVVFLLNILSKIINSAYFSLNKQFLVIDKLSFIEGSSHRRFSRDEIKQVYATRQLGKGSSPAPIYHLMVGTSTKLENITTDPLILRYVIWKLRQVLNLPNTSRSDEYIPYIEGKCHLKSLSFKSILGDIFAVLLVLFTCGWLPYWMRAFYIAQYEEEFARFRPFPERLVIFYSQLHLFCTILLIIGLVIIVGLIVFRLYDIWLAYQLTIYGKIIKAVVSETNTRHWTVQGKSGSRSYSANDVYYHYLDYEGHFNNWLLHQNDAIDICYLPNKPHISRPHPLETYYVYSIRPWVEFIVLMAAASSFILIASYRNGWLLAIYCVCIILISLKYGGPGGPLSD